MRAEYASCMEIHEALASALQAVADAKGTDLHLTIGEPPMARIDGLIEPIYGLPTVDAALMREYLDDLLGEDLSALERDLDVDFAFSHGTSRFRGNAFLQRGLPAIALRLMQTAIPTLNEI